MTQELTNKESTLPTTPAPQGAWGSENVSSSDLILPKVLLTQGLSRFANDDKIQARQGELRDSLEGKLLGSPTDPWKFIPFYTTRLWVNFEERQGKFEYTGQEPRTAANENRALEEIIGGVKFRRDKAINVYALSLDEVNSGEFLPYVISFRRTSYRAGMKLNTLMEKLKAFGLSPADRVFSLSSSKTENDKGIYFVLEVDRVMKDGKSVETTADQKIAAYRWYKSLAAQFQAGSVKEDLSDFAPQTASAPPPEEERY